MRSVKDVVGFVWDRGNRDKNWHKHRVSRNEAEPVFFDPHKREYPDPIHSTGEVRKIVVGQTRRGRMLFVVYTQRRQRIRIISARDLNRRKERDLYEKAA